MNLIRQLLQDWWGVIPTIALTIYFIKGFFNMPTEEQLEHVKRWLLWAVAQTELDLGSKMNKLKLARVYDMFVQRFPRLSQHITYGHFALLVDGALKELESMNITIINNISGDKEFFPIIKEGQSES